MNTDPTQKVKAKSKKKLIFYKPTAKPVRKLNFTETLNAFPNKEAYLLCSYVSPLRPFTVRMALIAYSEIPPA